MISRRITFSALFILILVASLFAGLTSCSDVFLQKESADFALSFVAPGASSGRSADGAADWNVTAWLELEDGTTLQSQQTTAVAGEPVAIPFAPVAAGTRLKVKVELVSATDYTVKHAGESDAIVVAEGDTTISLEVVRVKVNAPAPVITKQPEGKTESYVEGQDEMQHTLSVVANSPDPNGQLQYQWYSNDTNSTTGGQPFSDTDAQPEDINVTVKAGETKYFYCVITNEIVNNPYVNPTSATSNVVKVVYQDTKNDATSGDSSEITDENSLLEAINQAQDGEVVTITQEITVTNTIVINKNIVIEATGAGKLLRSNKGTVTGPMFDVSSSGNLTLQNITLDGQYDDDFYGGENNPFLINLGTTTLKSVTMQNIFMYQSADYNSITLNCGTIYSAGELSIVDSTIQNITMNASDATNIFIASGSVTISESTIARPVNPNNTEYNVLTMGANAEALKTITYDINGVTTGMDRVRAEAITPDSPSP